MEFIKFKINANRKHEFEGEFHKILRESNITCSQWEFHPKGNLVIAEIPKYAIDKMNEQEILLLNSFI